LLLQFGISVSCSDGPCGELSDVVVDPAARRVTQLVVQPQHHHALARLVPVGLAAVSDTPASPVLSLRCTTEDLHGLEPMERSDYLVLAEPPGDPYADLALEPGRDNPHVLVTYDTVPRGEVEIRATSAVRSADGHHLGHVRALVVDPNDLVSELVLVRGQRWPARSVTIPIGAIARVETDSVTQNRTRAAVHAL
jgi:sporulation protein YlmC with PRC-barrel domain